MKLPQTLKQKVEIRSKYVPSGSVVIAAWSTTAAGFVSGPLMLNSIPNTLSVFRSDVDFPIGNSLACMHDLPWQSAAAVFSG